MRTHFAFKPPFDAREVSACGRGQRLTSNPFRVDCLNCQKQDSFTLALDEAKSERYRAFMDQPLRTIAEPWQKGSIVCRVCGTDQFRIGDRTTYGHYQDYVCEAGHKESRLTETGMSF